MARPVLRSLRSRRTTLVAPLLIIIIEKIMENLVIPLFFKGYFIGLSLAAPVGPIGIWCIHKSLTDSLILALTIGFGAATADGIYGIIAAFGLTAVSSFLINHLTFLRVVGGGFLCFLGIQMLQKPLKPTNAEPAATSTIFSTYISSIILTLTNPITILAFIALFAGLGLGEAILNQTAAYLLAAGVFCGSLTWFTLLSIGIHFFKSYITENTLRWINKIAGLILLGFGLVALISIVKI